MLHYTKAQAEHSQNLFNLKSRLEGAEKIQKQLIHHLDVQMTLNEALNTTEESEGFKQLNLSIEGISRDYMGKTKFKMDYHDHMTKDLLKNYSILNTRRINELRSDLDKIYKEGV